MLKSTFFINNQGFTDKYIGVEVHANEEVPCINYALLIHCMMVPVSIDSPEFLHYFVLPVNIFTLTGNV